MQGSSGLLKKLGAGTLTLSNTSNSYAGGTILDNGILAVATDSVLGAASGGVTFAGGTLEATASFTSARGMTFNGAGGGVSVDSGQTLTLSGALTGPGLLAKVGFGTLILNGSPSIGGGYQVVRGTLDFLAVTLPIGFGTLTADAGATIQYDAGTTVVGGFLHGPGTHVVTGGAVLNGSTTYNSTVVNVTGAGSFINFTNGGSFNVTAAASTPVTLSQFTNDGSGSITIGAASAVTAADFQILRDIDAHPGGRRQRQATLLTNTGTSPLYFNGGSRTFIGTPATAGQNLALVDLHGQNAIVAGGLFVNNGFVGDSDRQRGDDHRRLRRAGQGGRDVYANAVITQNGGKFQAGNSPGKATFGQLVLGPGGTQAFNWQINNATGVAGPPPDANNQVSGWSLLCAEKIVDPFTGQTSTGDLNWTATSVAGNQFNMALQTLINPITVGQDTQGAMANFDNHAIVQLEVRQLAGHVHGADGRRDVDQHGAVRREQLRQPAGPGGHVQPALRRGGQGDRRGLLGAGAGHAGPDRGRRRSRMVGPSASAAVGVRRCSIVSRGPGPQPSLPPPRPHTASARPRRPGPARGASAPAPPCSRASRRCARPRSR